MSNIVTRNFDGLIYCNSISIINYYIIDGNNIILNVSYNFISSKYCNLCQNNSDPHLLKNYLDIRNEKSKNCSIYYNDYVFSSSFNSLSRVGNLTLYIPIRFLDLGAVFNHLYDNKGVS